MAPLTEEDRILIRILRAEKGYNAHQMMIEFPSRKWNKYALHRLIKQIDATGTSNSRNCGRRKHFSQSVMVSLAVSKLGKTAPFVVTPKAKVNSVYYCDEVLARGLLRDIRQLSGVDGYIFQQNGAPVSRNRVSPKISIPLSEMTVSVNFTLLAVSKCIQSYCLDLL